jgi:hypothetical protein
MYHLCDDAVAAHAIVTTLVSARSQYPVPMYNTVQPRLHSIGIVH